MTLQTDVVVVNILAGIIDSTGDAVFEVPSKNQPRSEAVTSDNLPPPRDPSQSTENNEYKNLTEERDMASSLANQLTKEKIELRAQIHRIAIELERTSA